MRGLVTKKRRGRGVRWGERKTNENTKKKRKTNENTKKEKKNEDIRHLQLRLLQFNLCLCAREA
jgi:hypothetical protein